jgi:hypothetical protein
MVIINLSSFAPRRILSLAAGILALSALTCFGQPVLFPVKSTPYDRQMERIGPILKCSAISNEHQIPLALVDHWIRDLRAIPYRFSVQWKTPPEVAREAVADCKGKAVALYQQLQANGAQNVRLVIGKRTPISGVTHTWLEWTTPAGTYLLDPTINRSACSLAEIPTNSYVPYYAYAGTRKYRVTNPDIFLAGL